MKKIFAVILSSLILSASMFALDIAVGGRGFVGANIDQHEDSTTWVSGGGAFINLDLFAGFGFQGEVNVNAKTITTGNNTITFTDYNILDFPFMAWFNFNLLNIVGIGGGAGLNFSFVNNTVSDDSQMNVGLAAGANVIFYLGRHFGIVAGAHGVFDFLPTFEKIASTDNSTTYKYSFDADYKRKSIYGSVGLEYRF